MEADDQLVDMEAAMDSPNQAMDPEMDDNMSPGNGDSQSQPFNAGDNSPSKIDMEGMDQMDGMDAMDDMEDY